VKLSLAEAECASGGCDTRLVVGSHPAAPAVIDATGPDGARVTDVVSATDGSGAAPTILCDHASGEPYSIGDTTVTCTATDGSGNAATGSFTVHVEGADEQLADLAAAVDGVGPGKSLSATVAIAQRLFAHGLTRSACLTLTTFDLKVRAQSGKKIPAPRATALLADGNRIKTVLGCST
jgi:hypothetical protein